MKPSSSSERTDPRGGAPARERELRAQGKQTMRKLLDAGMRVFDSRGYHAARVDDIVKVAETSHGTFYLYFSSKEDLLLALVHDVSDEMDALTEALPPIGPGEDGRRDLREWLGRFAQLYRHYGPVLRAWTEAQVYGGELAKLGADVLGGFARRLAAHIEQTDSAGAVDPEVAALAFVAMIERFNYLAPTMSFELDQEEVLDTIAAIVHAGVFGGTRADRGGKRRRRG